MIRSLIRPFLTLVFAAGVLLQAGAANAQSKNIIGTAQDAGTFTILLAGIKLTGLTDILSGPGPITIFAPTDDAFAKLPPETYRNLLKPENKEKLRNILLFHIVDGKATARDFLGKRLEAATMQGGSLLIDATKGVMVENAKIIKADIIADNGFIHVIDTVMMPR
jgi:uncharacterized surface protein with fasciclin (FAS1) repeats